MSAEAVQRFEKYEDLAAAKVTIEEREEYEQHMKKGTVVYAGVDYEKILRQVSFCACVKGCGTRILVYLQLEGEHY